MGLRGVLPDGLAIMHDHQGGAECMRPAAEPQQLLAQVLIILCLVDDPALAGQCLVCAYDMGIWELGRDI